jgi:hypothetical protein
MPVRYEHLGENPDGTPYFQVTSDTGMVVMTGPINGRVNIGGREIDVSAPFVEVADEAEAMALSDAIGERFVREGHPLFLVDPDKDSYGFVHIDSLGNATANAAITPDALVEAASMLGIDVSDVSMVVE